MKAKILAGAIAALMYGGTALAQDKAETKDQNQGTGGSSLIIVEEETAPMAPPPDVISGEAAPFEAPADVTALPANPDQGLGVGGSGMAGQQSGINMQGQGGVTLHCVPLQQGATGGSGDISSLERSYDDVDVGSVPLSGDDAFGGSGMEDMKQEKSKADMRGLTVLLGAGVEGYTGALAPNIDPGAAVGVTAAIKPSKVFGLELGYSGAVNNLDADVAGSGPDMVRNGAQAAVTLGLSATPVQPYVLGGFGMNWYNIRNGESLGFRDDTNARVPVGVGLRTHIGDFTADARVNYNVLISEDFAPVTNNELTTGSYNGTLNIGGTF